jgi:hypothetical protein
LRPALPPSRLCVAGARKAARRDTAGSAAAPAARCKNLRRGSFILNLPLASHHSITSSARASSLSGTSRPSAFAVLRLITNSNFVDCWTGKSAGPLAVAAGFLRSQTSDDSGRKGHLGLCRYLVPLPWRGEKQVDIMTPSLDVVLQQDHRPITSIRMQAPIAEKPVALPPAGGWPCSKVHRRNCRLLCARERVPRTRETSAC